MPRRLPISGVLSALLFASYVTLKLNNPRGINGNCPAACPAPEPEPERPRGKPIAAGIRAAEPVHKSVIRMWNDLDDLLDTIRDDRSFATVKPKLLARAWEQVAQAQLHPNAGTTPLGRLAAHEMREAAVRHDQSLERAAKVVPAVRTFFETQIAAILSPRR